MPRMWASKCHMLLIRMFVSEKSLLSQRIYQYWRFYSLIIVHVLVLYLGLFKSLNLPRDDLMRAIKKLKVMGNGFGMIPVGGSYLVQSVPAELNMDHTVVLQLAEVSSQSLIILFTCWSTLNPAALSHFSFTDYRSEKGVISKKKESSCLFMCLFICRKRVMWQWVRSGTVSNGRKSGLVTSWWVYLCSFPLLLSLTQTIISTLWNTEAEE